MLKYFRNKKWLIDQINEYRDRAMRNIQTIHDLHEVNKNLEAENLALLNRITNEPQPHDPDLKIDLSKPIRTKWSRDVRQIRQGVKFCYYVSSDDVQIGSGNVQDINAIYENYETLPVTAETGLENLKEAFKDYGTKLEDTGLSIKPKMDFINVKANEPLSIKNIVPKKEKIKSYVPNIKPGNENTEVEWVEIIDMTNKSKAVRRLMSDILFSIHNRFVYEENGYLLSDLSVFPDETFLSYNVTRDNVRKMMKNYIDNGLIKKGVNGDYLAAKPIKIMLEKEK